MRLGILINTDKHLGAILGITKAAVSKGHEVILFNMDSGTRLLEDPAFTALCKLEGVRMGFCDHSAKNHDVKTDAIPGDIACGSQYNNAVMMHEADKVVRL